MTSIDLAAAAKAFENEIRPTTEDMQLYIQSIQAALEEIGVGRMMTLIEGNHDAFEYSTRLVRQQGYECTSLSLLLNAKPGKVHPDHFNTDYLEPGDEIDPTIKPAAFDGVAVELYVLKIFKQGSPKIVDVDLHIRYDVTATVDYREDESGKKTQAIPVMMEEKHEKRSDFKHRCSWDQRETMLRPLIKLLVEFGSPELRRKILPPQESPKVSLKP